MAEVQHMGPQRWLLVGFALFACHAEEPPVFIDISGHDFDLGFVIGVGESEGVVSISAPLGSAPGLSSGSPSVGALAARNFLLELSTEDLRALHPIASPMKWAESRLVGNEAPDCTSTFKDPAQTRIRVPLGSLAPEWPKLFELMPGASSQLVPVTTDQIPAYSELHLELSYDEDLCLSDTPPDFSSFTANDPVAALGTVVGTSTLSRAELRFRWLTRFEDNVITASSWALFLLHRGEVFEPTPRTVLTSTELRRGSHIQGIAFDPEVSRGRDGGRRLIVALGLPSGEGQLYEISVGTVAMIPVGRLVADLGEIESVLIEPESGRILVTVYQNEVLVFEPDGQLVGRVQLDEGPPNDARPDNRLGFLPDPARPFYAAGTEQEVVFRGTKDGLDWQPSSGLGTALNINSVAGFYRDPDGLELWAGGSRGVIAVRTKASSPPVLFQPYMPERYESCSSGTRDACGQLVLQESIPGLGAGGDRLYGALATCSAALVVSRDRRCARVIGFPGRPIRSTDDGYDVLHVNESWVTMASGQGGVYEVPLDGRP